MKLKIRRTVDIGTAFLTIMMLWQVYNFAVPLFLEDLLLRLLPKASKIMIGVIMALDNLVALFMIPLVGYLSDKTKTKWGKRVPYIFVGVILSSVAFMAVPFVYNAANAAETTGMLFVLIFNLLLVLVFMNAYRSPAVALMPDITPKQLRSKANSIINIMGGVGALIGFAANLFFNKAEGEIYLPFIIVAVFMALALMYFLMRVNENKFVSEYESELAEYNRKLEAGELRPEEILPDEEKEAEFSEQQQKVKGAKLPRHLLFVLLTVFFVYMSVNAVETFLSLYSSNVLGTEKYAKLFIPVFAVTGFAFAIPSSMFAAKLGRRLVILLGCIIMGVCYLMLYGFQLACTGLGWTPYLMNIPFLFAGVGFSFVVVNIYPMAVQSSDEKDLGKFTGMYYTASMLAQSITPALSGALMTVPAFGYPALMPYSAVFMGLAYLSLLLAMPTKSKRKKFLSEIGGEVPPDGEM